MSLKKEPEDRPRKVDYRNPPPAQQVRELLARAGLSQRQGARELGVDERTMRYWCSGEEGRGPPALAILALEQLVNKVRELHDEPTDPSIQRWRQSIARNQATIDLLESGKAAIGNGPGAGSERSARVEANMLRQKNEKLLRLIDVRTRKLEGTLELTAAGKGRDVIDRLEDAFEHRQAAFRTMYDEFLPHGDGVLSEGTMDEFDLRDQEWKSVKAEADRIVEEIKAGKR